VQIRGAGHCARWLECAIGGGGGGGSGVASLGTDTADPSGSRERFAHSGDDGKLRARFAYGLIAFASSLDRIGPLRAMWRRCGMLKVMAGRDPNDSTSTTAPVEDYSAELKKPVKGMKVASRKSISARGWIRVRGKITAGLNCCATGLPVMDIQMPHTDYPSQRITLLRRQRRASNLARYDGVRYACAKKLTHCGNVPETRGRVRPEVKRRIVLGTTYFRGYYDAYYLKGQKVRH